MDRVDDLAGVDLLKINRRDPEVRCPSWRWMIGSGIRSWAISIA
jgi:hypothetical protein